MAKKTSPTPPAPRRRQPKTPSAAAPAPVDVATVAGTETMESAADHSSRAQTAGTKPGPTPDEIAEAAYHRYLNRGKQDGSDFDDWLEAERELRSQTKR